MGEEGKLFVGNISYETSEEKLQETFEEYGVVDDVVIIKDRDTGSSRGFGFVTFQESKNANAAIEALHKSDLDGREITVNKANQRRSEGGGNSRGRGYNRGGGQDRSRYGGRESDNGRRGDYGGNDNRNDSY